jgi:uncharacterized lipoprotein YddW (UPF0748 family)
MMHYLKVSSFVTSGGDIVTARDAAPGHLRPLRRLFWTALLLLGWLAKTGGADAVPSGNPEKPTLPADKTRGVWMWSSDVRQEGAEAVAQRLALHHINKVFFLVKGTAGSVCYPSKLAPSPESGKDALQAILDACHKRRIEVHAWYMFNADNAWGKKHPEDRMWGAGKPEAWNLGPQPVNDPQVTHICPLSPGYLPYLKSLIQEVLDRYPVDGIHLDGIRYSHVQYCFCPRHQAFAATNGVHLEKVRAAIYDTFYAPKHKPDYYFKLYRTGDPDVAEWVSLREKEIDRAVMEVRKVVKGKSPAMVLSASFMPEGGERDDTFALCHYAQNYASAGAQLDYILPMTYHKSFGRTPAWVVQVAQNAERKSERPVYSGIQAFERDPSRRTQPADNQADVLEARGISAQELRDTVTTVEKQGIKGFVLFRYGSLTDQMWEALPQ